MFTLDWTFTYYEFIFLLFISGSCATDEHVFYTYRANPEDHLQKQMRYTEILCCVDQIHFIKELEEQGHLTKLLILTSLMLSGDPLYVLVSFLLYLLYLCRHICISAWSICRLISHWHCLYLVFYPVLFLASSLWSSHLWTPTRFRAMLLDILCFHRFYCVFFCCSLVPAQGTGILRSSLTWRREQWASSCKRRSESLHSRSSATKGRNSSCFSNAPVLHTDQSSGSKPSMHTHILYTRGSVL